MFKDNKKKYDLFRKEYDTMVFEGYNFVETTSEIKVTYHFNLSDKYFFHPDLIILKKTGLWDLANLNALDSMLFHIGMVEMISYWKVACPPHIIIKPFRLSQQQLDFWKKLYYNGLGEFFYINNIIPNSDDFVTFRCESGQALDILKINVDENKVIIPVGGGKDSIVSLELLKNHFDVIPFILNPREASLDTCYTAGFDRAGIFEIKRTIDPLLLELNNKGFLNGHTPFSALLAFVSLIVAAYTGAKYIALSNESSANEPTVENGANHQYSKSLEFESDFREYVKNLITGEIEYFSFLRPLSEFYIAKIFSNFESYFGVFKSCNVGSKSNSWCGNCPKCLFTYIILSPFVDRDKLVSIFEKNLFADEKLLPEFKELTGVSPVKPFECVGTVGEVNLALTQTINSADTDLPFLLSYYAKMMGGVNQGHYSDVLHFDPDNHHLPRQFLKILKRNIYGFES